MAVTEVVQETVQSVTGAAQHAVEEVKALLPQKEPPCELKSDYDLYQLHILTRPRVLCYMLSCFV